MTDPFDAAGDDLRTRIERRSVDPTELRPPSRWRLLGETRVALDLLSLLLRRPGLRRGAKEADGEPVIVLPGYGTTDSWTASLRKFLRSVGFDARGWGLGRNSGNVRALLPRLVESAEGLAEASGKAVRLVGWSLGGYLARESARECPTAIERVVTLGTPVVGGPKYTATARSYTKRGYDLDAIEAAVEQRNESPLEVPIVAIFSRSDGVVSWRACIDRRHDRVEHVEVSSSHFGLIFRPAVLAVIAEGLLASHGDERLGE